MLRSASKIDCEKIVSGNRVGSKQMTAIRQHPQLLAPKIARIAARGRALPIDFPRRS
jgi:hypothetical protein